MLVVPLKRPLLNHLVADGVQNVRVDTLIEGTGVGYLLFDGARDCCAVASKDASKA